MSEELRVLIIDDEEAIRAVLRRNLQAVGYQTDEALNGRQGLEKILTYHPNLLLLDLGLPDISGLQVMKELRKWSRVPTIILTVKDDESTKVSLLDAGADDYLTKPFGTQELLARVRVVLRNVGFVEATPFFKSGDLEVDLNQHKVIVSNREIKLTMTEFELLARLVRDQGRIVPQQQLMRQIWGTTAMDQVHYLRIYVNQLRKKIEANPSEPRHILTEPGVGYRLV